MALRNILFDIVVRGEKARAELQKIADRFRSAGTEADQAAQDTKDYTQETDKAGQSSKRLSSQTQKTTRDVHSVRSQLKRAREEMTRNTKAGGGLSRVMGKVGLAFSAIQALNFAKDSALLAAETEGVVRAFERLPESEQILKNLRAATKGTVEDLELMRSAVRAGQFGLPIEELGNLLAFAKSRADDTGESVDVLVDKIVRGIGRKSVLILDDLGLSASQIKDELGGAAVEASSVAEITRAVGSIASRELAKAGDQADTTKNRYEQLRVTYENIRQSVGRLVNELVGDFLPGAAGAAVQIREFFENIDIEKAKLLLKVLLNLTKAYLVLKAAQVGARVAMVASNAVMVGARAISLTLAVAQNVLAGNTTRAAAAFRLLTAAVLSNPFLLIAGTLIAIGPLLFNFVRDLTRGKEEIEQLTEEQELLNKATDSYNKNLKAGIAEARAQFALLRETNAGTKERRDLINDINRTYGTTLKNLEDETAFLRQLDAAYAGVISSLKQKIALQVREEQLKPLIEEEIQIREDLAKIQETIADNVEAQGDADQFKPFQDGVKAVGREYFELQTRLNEVLGLQKTLFNLDFLGGGGAANSPVVTATKEASDVLAGSIAAIKKDIADLERQRDEQIKLFVDGAINLEQYKKITQEIEAERKRLNDALEAISPVEPYKAQSDSIAEIQKEIDSLQQAIAATQARGFLTEGDVEQLNALLAKLEEAKAKVLDLAIKNQIDLEAEELRHQQEILKIQSDFSDLSDEERRQAEAELDAQLLQMEIDFLKRKLELRREAGDLTVLEETAILNQIEELQLERQKTLEGKMLDQHKDFLQQWKDLELKERAELATKVTQEVFDLAQTLNEIQLRQLQNLTRLQEQRVQEATQLAQEGNVELLKAEQDRLDELNRKRAEFVRQQQLLSAIEVAANAAVAIAKAAAEGGVAAPFTIAATLIALTAGLAQARALASQEAFREGVIDYQGKGTGTSDSNVVRISHGESVITASGTDRAPKLLEAINEGRISDSVFDKIFTGRNMAALEVAGSSGGHKPDDRQLKEIASILKGQMRESWSFPGRTVIRTVEKSNQSKRRILTRI